MSMKPPAHICGPMKNTYPLEVRQERLAWVHAAHAAGVTNPEIARLLGVSPALASKLLTQEPPKTKEPEKHLLSVRMPSMFGDRYTVVNLPPNPWKTEALRPDPRPETAPPRGIKSKRNGVTPEGFIAILRAECLKARAEA